MYEELEQQAPGEVLAMPSLPKATNEWGYTGSRYQEPGRASSAKGAAPFRERVTIASESPFPAANGPHIFPEAARESVRFRDFPGLWAFGKTSWACYRREPGS